MANRKIIEMHSEQSWKTNHNQQQLQDFYRFSIAHQIATESFALSEEQKNQKPA